MAFLAERLTVGDGEALTHALEALAIEDLWLTCACLQGNNTAHRELRAMMGAVADALRAQRVSDDIRDEALQSILEALLVGRAGSKPKLANYSGKGALRAWLRTAVFRELVRISRRTRRDELEEGIQDCLDLGGTSPELKQIKEECRVAFRKAFAAALQRLDTQSRLLLRYWVYDSLTLQELARALCESRTTVISRIRDTQKSLLKNTLLEIGKDLSLNRAEVESMLRELGSRLEASLSDALGAGDDSDEV